MHTPAPVQLESSDILQGLVNNKGQFDPMQILREGPEATPQQILDMAMDNRAEHFDLIGACVGSDGRMGAIEHGCPPGRWLGVS